MLYPWRLQIPTWVTALKSISTVNYVLACKMTSVTRVASESIMIFGSPPTIGMKHVNFVGLV